MTDFNGLNATVRPWSPRPQQLAILKFVPRCAHRDLAHFASSPQSVPAAFSITADSLDQFLHDPAPRDHLERSVLPVLLVFEAWADYWRLGSIVPALPLSNDEEARLDHDEQARLDEADEARCDHDDQAPLDDADDARLDDDDEPTWNYRE
jgi:hypothetical protein